MKKSGQKLLLVSSLAIVLLAGCSSGGASSSVASSSVSSEIVASSSTASESSEEASSSLASISSSSSSVQKLEVLDDPSFATGFDLKSPEVVDNTVPIVRHFDYLGTAKTGNNWQMAQWHTPFDFKDATETKDSDGPYHYENESRSFTVDPITGKMSFSLNSWAEYQEVYGGSRTGSSQPWSHFLLEQNFTKPVFANNLDALYLNLDFSIDELTAYDAENYSPSRHAAQYLWYFTLQNITPEGSDESKLGTYGDYMWFGVPLFDNRSDYSAEVKSIDAGFNGATNKMIYGMDNRNYLPVSAGHPLMIGATYHIKDFDVLPYMRDAFVYGVQHDALKNVNWSNVRLGYLNFGFELPGSFKMSTTIENWSVVAQYA